MKSSGSSNDDDENTRAVPAAPARSYPSLIVKVGPKDSVSYCRMKTKYLVRKYLV